MKKFFSFLSEGIWLKDESEYKNHYVRWAIHQIKIISVTIEGIGKHNIAVQSAALTFYTLISLVPIIALIFAIFKGIGFESYLFDNLYSSFPDHTGLITSVRGFADNLLENAKGGVIAGVGLVVLFWGIMRVFGSAESVFNQIWDVKRSRSLTRKFSDYVTVVIVAPFLWILSNSFSSWVRTNLMGIADKVFIDVLFWAVSLIALWALFTFLYMVMPNTKVRFRSAMTAGIVAGSAFYLFQLIYLWLQSSVMAYNAIYGGFAFLPLFMIWMQVSWQILLFGAELSYAYQNLSKYEQELQALGMSYRERQKVLLATLITIDRHFNRNTGAVTSEQIAGELGLPVRIVKDVIFDLEGAGLVAAAKDNYNERVNRYLPLKNIDQMRISDVINVVETKGEESVIPQDNELLHAIGEVLDKINTRNSEWDKPLSQFF